jgi:hypothetical protein
MAIAAQLFEQRNHLGQLLLGQYIDLQIELGALFSLTGFAILRERAVTRVPTSCECA